MSKQRPSFPFEGWQPDSPALLSRAELNAAIETSYQQAEDAFLAQARVLASGQHGAIMAHDVFRALGWGETERDFFDERNWSSNIPRRLERRALLRIQSVAERSYPRHEMPPAGVANYELRIC